MKFESHLSYASFWSHKQLHMDSLANTALLSNKDTASPRRVQHPAAEEALQPWSCTAWPGLCTFLGSLQSKQAEPGAHCKNSTEQYFASHPVASAVMFVSSASCTILLNLFFIQVFWE